MGDCCWFLWKYENLIYYWHSAITDKMSFNELKWMVLPTDAGEVGAEDGHKGEQLQDVEDEKA